MSRPPVPGWRLFRCDDCLATFWRATRDYMSLSTDQCTCGVLCFPQWSVEDRSLRIDCFGNLIEPYADFVMLCPTVLRAGEAAPNPERAVAPILGGVASQPVEVSAVFEEAGQEAMLHTQLCRVLCDLGAAWADQLNGQPTIADVSLLAAMRRLRKVLVGCRVELRLSAAAEEALRFADNLHTLLS